MNTPGRRNVVLVGFMGSGKSSVGRLIARTLDGRFVDTDRLVVDRTGSDIPSIFARNGEAFFRVEERRALESLKDETGLVVATGGGIVTVEGNAELLKALGYVVWLDASEEVIWERVSRNANRPLLHTGNPRETVKSLLKARKPAYAAVADLHVDTTRLKHLEVAEMVCAKVRELEK